MLSRLFRKTWRVLWFLCRTLLVAWATLAIYYSNLPSSKARLALTLAFLAFGMWSLVSHKRRVQWVFGGAFLGVLIWWITIRPPPHLEWRPEVAVMPRAIIDGDQVRFTGYRNFDYRTRDDFTIRYENREVAISHLTGVDLDISYWRQGVVAHTFVSFCFDNAPPVCVSIEVRPEVGKSFSVIPSLFKQFQLIYVVGDERDIVRVRTNYRDEDVYLYHVRASAEQAQELFRLYLNRINKLADHPEFYHLLKNSCTINIVRYAQTVGGHPHFDYRYVLNGLLDQYLYSQGHIDTSLPFAELRERSHINKAAQAADQAEDFSTRIREGLPVPK